MKTEQRRPARANGAGFTLLEIVIALVVVAVLATLAVPSFSGTVVRTRLHHAAQALAADLAEARFQAARDASALYVVPNADARCWAVATVADCGCGAPAPCQRQRVDATAWHGVEFIAAQPVRLAPDGTAPATVVAVLGSAAGDRVQVTMGPLGRAHVCVAAGAAGVYARC